MRRESERQTMLGLLQARLSDYCESGRESRSEQRRECNSVWVTEWERDRERERGCLIWVSRRAASSEALLTSLSAFVLPPKKPHSFLSPLRNFSLDLSHLVFVFSYNSYFLTLAFFYNRCRGTKKTNAAVFNDNERKERKKKTGWIFPAFFASITENALPGFFRFEHQLWNNQPVIINWLN